MLCWIDHVWSSKECACWACDPSVHLRGPSIGFVLSMSEVISSFKKDFKSWITCVCSPHVISFCHFAHHMVG